MPGSCAQHPAGSRLQAHPDHGLFFEDVREGDWFDSREVEVDEASVVTFAKEWDPQPFHVDKAAAARSVFGGLSASGLQTVMLTYRLYVESGMFQGTALAGLGIDKIRFKEPLRPGDRIRARTVLASVRRTSKPGRAVARIVLHTFNQHGREIASMELNFLLACREP